MTPAEQAFGVSEHSLIGPFVVDALTDAERAQFEAHLDLCARCRDEVAELSEALVGVADDLVTAPPTALRGSILAAISGIEQDPPVAAPPVAAPAVAPVELAPVEAAETSWDWQVEHAPVDELALRRSRRAARVLTLAVAAVAVLALALGGWVYNLNQQRQSDIAAQQQAQQQAQAERQRETDLLAAPDAKVITKDVKGARYSFVVSKSRNQALFLGTNLPDPGADKRYQLWTVGTEPLVDSSVTGSGSVRQWFSGPIDDSAALAINIEPSSGPPAPNKPSGEILTAVEI